MPLPHLGADLRRDDHVVVPAASRDPAADDRLRFPTFMTRHPTRVRICGVQEIETRFDKCVEQPKRHCFVRCPAKHVTAERERRDIVAGVTKFAFFHVVISSARAGPRARLT